MSDTQPIDDGGPAFPTVILEDTPMLRLPDGTIRPVGGGMSLRDWFAGQALVGLLSSGGDDIDANGYAKGAYVVADAMIAERKKAKE